MKNTNFNIQIIIKSDKENIEDNIKKIEQQKEIEKSLNNNFMVNIIDSYIEFIKEKNEEKLSSSKNFYIIINSIKFPENQEKEIILNLKEKYLKIKDALSRCGNTVAEINNKEELKNIIKSFYL